MPCATERPTGKKRYDEERVLELVRRAQEGDHEAFNELDKMYRQRILRTCRKTMKGAEGAEDATQETFIKLYTKIGTFQGKSAFYTWLHRIAKNECLMILRRKRLPMVSLDSPTALRNATAEIEGGEVRLDVAVNDPALTSLADRELVEKAFKLVPEGQRTIVVLRSFEGYEYNEIAAMLGCSTGNAKSQYFRGACSILLAIARLYGIDHNFGSSRLTSRKKAKLLRLIAAKRNDARMFPRERPL